MKNMHGPLHKKEDWLTCGVGPTCINCCYPRESNYIFCHQCLAAIKIVPDRDYEFFKQAIASIFVLKDIQNNIAKVFEPITSNYYFIDLNTYSWTSP